MKRRKWLMLGAAGIVVVVMAVLGLWWVLGGHSTVEEKSNTEQADESGTNQPGDTEENTEEPSGPEANMTEEPSGGDAPDNSSAQNWGQNYTLGWGRLMLINPIFTVGTDFIAARRGELVDVTDRYGIVEGKAGNGRPLLDPEAAPHLAEMVQAYQATYPGHTLQTRSCFRAVGTQCGRLCYATGTSDHHTGYTCDLIDPSYGTALDTDLLAEHPEWQWLKENSWKYGFIDRFPIEWAGGPMSGPINMTAEGSTGLYEVWHYRYVGLEAAKEIAEGKYNGGKYDSLEHYLRATGRVKNLLQM